VFVILRLVLPMLTVFKYNFYVKEFFFVNDLLFSFLPELLLLIFILYITITIFNDYNKEVFQYYKVFIFFLFLMVIFFIKLIFTLLFFSFLSTKVILGFFWINSFYTLFSKMLITSLTILILFISKDKFIKVNKLNCMIEFPLILLFSILFLFLLTSSYDFFGVYLSLEGLSLTLYVLAGMLHQGVVSVEGAIKYFSLGAISTGILLFGVSCLFCCVGGLDFLELQVFLGSNLFLKSFFEVKLSLLFITFGFLFKISAFPCHIWVADVYEGIWTPVTAYFAVVIKVGLILFYLRITFNTMFNILFFFQPIFIFISLGSIFIGALGAFKQTRIKRFIAYTSINQVGFIFLGIASCNLTGLIASLIYTFLYSIMSINFFTLLLNINHVVTNRSMLYLSDLYCFCFYSVEGSNYLVLVILSMGGLPPLGGFLGKLFLYFALMEARLDFTIFFSLILSILTIYYYLSFVRFIWFEKSRVLKLYYLKKKVFLNFLLRFFSVVLLLFGLIFSGILPVFTYLSLSCLFPFIWN